MLGREQETLFGMLALRQYEQRRTLSTCLGECETEACLTVDGAAEGQDGCPSDLGALISEVLNEEGGRQTTINCAFAGEAELVEGV